MPLAEVTVLNPSLSIPAMLRRLADEIESGEHKGVIEAVCVIEKPERLFEVFSWGTTREHCSAAGAVALLEAGKFDLYRKGHL